MKTKIWWLICNLIAILVLVMSHVTVWYTESIAVSMDDEYNEEVEAAKESVLDQVRSIRFVVFIVWIWGSLMFVVYPFRSKKTTQFIGWRRSHWII